MVLQTGMEFNEAVFHELKSREYSHILHSPPKTMQGEDNYIHWIEPLKYDDIRHDFEEAELFIQAIDDFDVQDMAQGMVGVIFKIKMPQF